MTNEQLALRGRQAEAAFNDYVAPAIEQSRAEYLEAITRLAANEPWSSDKIVKLSIAMRVIDKVAEQMKTTMVNGAEAARRIERAKEIANLPAAKRRWLDTIAP